MAFFTSVSKRTPREQGAGFTLLETLISVLILSSIMAAGTASISTILKGKAASETRLERLEALERTTAFLRQDIGAARPRIWETSRSGSRPRNMFGGRPTAEDAYLGLVRSGWGNPDYEDERSDLLAVEYRFRDGALIRHLILRPDPTRITPTQDEVLLTGISDIEVSFRAGGVFSAQWDLAIEEGVALLPDSVRIELEFETGERLDQVFLVGGRQ